MLGHFTRKVLVYRQYFHIDPAVMEKFRIFLPGIA